MIAITEPAVMHQTVLSANMKAVLSSFTSNQIEPQRSTHVSRKEVLYLSATNKQSSCVDNTAFLHVPTGGPKFGAYSSFTYCLATKLFRKLHLLTDKYRCVTLKSSDMPNDTYHSAYPPLSTMHEIQSWNSRQKGNI